MVNPKQQIKVVLMGMENAGKTTIVDILKQKTTISLTKPPNMNPTKGVERSYLIQNLILIWDFGGQEHYRNEYLAKPDSYFHDIAYCYYVVDIQDYYRLPGSIIYFMSIFKLIQKFSPEAKIIFLFHKMDPGYDEMIRNLKGKFLEKIEPLLEKNSTPFGIYHTSIFNLNSIKTAFNQVL